ncbi:MAG: tetratricopeptide repeat protein, partial [Candidatus Krumholzibacteria bacterium]|nr:tetratricopeptide repeat protein [Candidatus Krumholzibacteria bacterium]
AAFDMAGKESSSSPYALLAQQKATSIKRLLELQKGASEGASGEQMAQRRFMAAEIQFTRLGEIDPALVNYRAVIDSFPESSYAPKAAYATAWIYKRQKSDTLKAVEAFAALISRYPRSQQAKGALEELFAMKADDMGMRWQAYIDSAMADTAAIAAELAARRASYVADSLAMAARHLPGRGSTQDPAVDGARAQRRPAPREGDKAADRAGSSPAGEISASMMHLMARNKFDRLRREMWGTGAAAQDTSREPGGR